MNRTIRQLLLPTAFVVLAILMPAQASASVLAVEQDCADSDVFEQKHSRQDLQDALTQIQADLAEYGTCRQMINAALAAMAKADARKNSNGGDGPGATAADLDGDGVVTPEEKAVAIKRAKQKQKQRNQEIAAISDDLVQDDAATSVGDSGSGGPSLPLILAIVALLCAGIGGGVWYAAKRNPAFANALRRVAPPFGNS